MELRQRVLHFVRASDVPFDGELNDRTSLLRSGVLDSLALFNLALWIENEVGQPIDLTTFDLMEEWDTVNDIVCFIDRKLGKETVFATTGREDTVMEAEGYEIIKYSSDHAEPVARLLTHVQRPNVEFCDAYREWLYDRNPYLPEPAVYLALHEGRVVGMRGFHGAQWEAGPGQRAICPCGSGLVVAPEHRNRGLPTLLLNALLEGFRGSGYPFLFSLGGVPVTILALRATGWRALEAVETVSRSSLSGRMRRFAQTQFRQHPNWLGTFRRAETSVRRLGRTKPSSAPGDAAQRPARVFDRFDRNSRGLIRSGAISVDDKAHPAAMAALIRSLDYDGRIRHVRNERYLAWRFDNPAREYRFLYLGGDEIEGYLVLSGPRFGWTKDVVIADWEARTPRLRRDLIEAVMKLGEFSSLAIWSTGLSDEEKGLLVRCGFKSEHNEVSIASTGPTILAKAMSASPPEEWSLAERPILDIGNWNFRMIYSDLY
jgi:GNAT superfamily N-acetyltransferase/acyl carrier protein